jgi:hypothetical protein
MIRVFAPPSGGVSCILGVLAAQKNAGKSVLWRALGPYGAGGRREPLGGSKEGVRLWGHGSRRAGLTAVDMV